MKIEKEEKVEKANVVINIQTAYNVNPAATKVENTFIIGSAKEANRALAEATGGRDGINPDVVRPEIIKYVSRVLPLLHDAPKGYFIKMWNDILDLPAVKDKVYNPGQQVGPIFNRDLIANILHHLRTYKIYKVVYRDNYNGAALAEALEGCKDHAVTNPLRDDPPRDVRDAVNKLIKEKY